MCRVSEGVKDVIVTGVFHGWFGQDTAKRMAGFYGITRDELVKYAVDELGYDIDKDEFTVFFGDKNDWKK